MMFSYDRKLELPDGTHVGVSYDAAGNSGYVCFGCGLHDGAACVNVVARTVDIGSGVLLDYGVGGRLLGVEIVGGEPDIGDVLYALRAVAGEGQ